MAKEIKSTNVHPSDEEATIKVWQTFGWEFVSTQEVKTADQHWRDNTHYYAKKGEHYVKLTFQRESTIPNYTQLADLQKQYDSVIDPELPAPRFGYPFFELGGFIPIGIWTILMVIGLLLYVVPGVLIIIWRCIAYSKKTKAWETEYAACTQKRNEILAQAQGLEK